MTMPRTEVQRYTLSAGFEVLECAQMRLGEILDMDVVADRRAVRGRVIGAVDLDVGPPSESGLKHERNEVSLRLVAFTDFTVGVGTGGIKIAERHPAQPIGLAIPMQCPLNRELGLAIG